MLNKGVSSLWNFILILRLNTDNELMRNKMKVFSEEIHIGVLYASLLEWDHFKIKDGIKWLYAQSH